MKLDLSIRLVEVGRLCTCDEEDGHDNDEKNHR